jgi:hypothetical protein
MPTYKASIVAAGAACEPAISNFAPGESSRATVVAPARSGDRVGGGPAVASGKKLLLGRWRFPCREPRRINRNAPDDC